MRRLNAGSTAVSKHGAARANRNRAIFLPQSTKVIVRRFVLVRFVSYKTCADRHVRVLLSSGRPGTSGIGPSQGPLSARTRNLYKHRWMDHIAFSFVIKIYDKIVRHPNVHKLLKTKQIEFLTFGAGNAII
jgi:hypothetical protein